MPLPFHTFFNSWLKLEWFAKEHVVKSCEEPKSDNLKDVRQAKISPSSLKMFLMLSQAQTFMIIDFPCVLSLLKILLSM